MEITVRNIGNKFQEVIFDQLGMTTSTGTLDEKGQIDQAIKFLTAARELIDNINIREST